RARYRRRYFLAHVSRDSCNPLRDWLRYRRGTQEASVDSPLHPPAKSEDRLPAPDRLHLIWISRAAGGSAEHPASSARSLHFGRRPPSHPSDRGVRSSRRYFTTSPDRVG